MTGAERAEALNRLHTNLAGLEGRAGQAKRLVVDADTFGELAIADMSKHLRLAGEFLQAIADDVELFAKSQLEVG